MISMECKMATRKATTKFSKSARHPIAVRKNPKSVTAHAAVSKDYRSERQVHEAAALEYWRHNLSSEALQQSPLTEKYASLASEPSKGSNARLFIRANVDLKQRLTQAAVLRHQTTTEFVLAAA